MSRDEMLVELVADVLGVLGKRNLKQAERAGEIVAFFADLLDPAAIAAVSVPSAHIAVREIQLGNAIIEIDANDDLVRVELSAPAEIEIHERA